MWRRRETRNRPARRTRHPDAGILLAGRLIAALRPLQNGSISALSVGCWAREKISEHRYRESPASSRRNPQNSAQRFTVASATPGHPHPRPAPLAHSKIVQVSRHFLPELSSGTPLPGDIFVFKPVKLSRSNKIHNVPAVGKSSR